MIKDGPKGKEMKLSVWSVWIPLTCQKISVTARLGPEQREAERSQGKPAARAVCCEGRAAADTAEPEQTTLGD